MVKRKVERDSVVKVDAQLLGRVENFVKKNRFRYVSKKQFVDLAIIEFLKSEKLGNKSSKFIKRGKNARS